MISSLPSSYGSGKVSPLTPSDSVGALHHSSAFPPTSGKDYPPSSFPDFGPDRRVSSYQSDLSDDYAMGNNPYSPSIQHFQDRLARFTPDNRFNNSNGNSGPPHGLPPHGISPHATHPYRTENGVNGYEDMPHYMGNPHGDMASLRMPTVDEQLARVALRGHSIMGASNDLQTFIR